MWLIFIPTEKSESFQRVAICSKTRSKTVSTGIERRIRRIKMIWMQARVTRVQASHTLHKGGKKSKRQNFAIGRQN